MSDFIREVDEDLRQDRFKRVLNRYWYVIALLVVLILGGVGAWKAYDYWRTQKAEAASGRYLAALDLLRDGKAEEGVAALRQVQADGTPGYQLLARFRLAGETAAKDPAAAAQLYDELAADPSVDVAARNVARLRQSMLLLDRLPYADFKARTEPLADANSPVRNPARELLALSALKAGDAADAARFLQAIQADPTTPGSLRQRADLLAALARPAEPAPQPAAPPAIPPALQAETPAAPPATAPAPAAEATPEAAPAPAASTPAPPAAPSAPAATVPPPAAPAP